MTASITIHLYAFPSGCTTTARHLKQCDGLVSSSEIVLIMDQNKATPVETQFAKKKQGLPSEGKAADSHGLRPKRHVVASHTDRAAVAVMLWKILAGSSAQRRGAAELHQNQ